MKEAAAPSSDMYSDVLKAVSSKHFKDRLFNLTSQKISDVAVEAVIENTRSPTQAPSPGEACFKTCALLFIATYCLHITKSARPHFQLSPDTNGA